MRHSLRWQRFETAVLLAVALVTPALHGQSCSNLSDRNDWLRFNASGVQHYAHLVLNGCSGVMYVRFYDANWGRAAVVTETMRVVDAQDGMHIDGENPVDSATGVVRSSYLPDKLVLRISPNGSQELSNCYQVGGCLPVLQAAQLVIHNRCSKAISVAAVYSDAAADEEWVRTGWWNVGADSTLYTSLRTFADHFFTYAEADGSPWPGTDPFTVKQVRFRVGIDESLDATSARTVNFHRVDIGEQPAVIQNQNFDCQ